MGEGVMVGNLTAGLIPRTRRTQEGTPEHTNYLLSAFWQEKCGQFNLAVINPAVIIQQKGGLQAGTESSHCTEMY